MTVALPLDALRTAFGDRLQENVLLAPYTSARIGGPADALLTVESADELAKAAGLLWKLGVPYWVLGGGSNVLVSDLGVRGLIVLNRAKAVRFTAGEPTSVRAESGTVFSNLAHQAAARGFSGLEWATTIPGTVGGAVYGNAGAFGGDMASSLIQAELATEAGCQAWPVEKMGYSYRTSILKRAEIKAVILAAEMHLKAGQPEAIKTQVREITELRKNTQPPGASMGSMFKNPPGDYAGRLIEAVGLKGKRIGTAEISPVHANFFINHGQTRASDVRALIELAQNIVAQKLGIILELEIELIGEW
jgi:UDP-N-acetylmuramate dehydrogenase